MRTDAALGITSLRLADFYKINQLRINESMARVSSGNRVRTPADGGVDYFHAQQMKADIRGYEQVRREITFGLSLLDVAKESGTMVFEDLNHMRELLKFYHDPSRSGDEREAYEIEFETIKDRIAREIDTAYYDKWKLIADNGSDPLMKIVLNPRNVEETYDISFGAEDLADVSSLTIGSAGEAAEVAALQAQLNKAASYLAKAVTYYDGLSAHHSLAGRTTVSYAESVENTEHIDEGGEIMALTKRNISQQMTVAMLAQANMFRSGIAALVQGGK